MKTKQLNKKNLLKSKLLSYSAAAGALFAIGEGADAQIIYTDIEPDSTVSAGPRQSSAYELDINNDGTIDVKIAQHHSDIWNDGDDGSKWGWISVRGLPLKSASLATVLDSNVAYNTEVTYAFVKRFDFGDIIGPDQDWKSVTDTQTKYASIYFGFKAFGLGDDHDQVSYGGEWSDSVPDKYMGVRISLDGGETHNYGWVRLDVPKDQSKFTIKDYAFETTPDKAIDAGSGVTGISKNGLNDTGIKVFSFEKNIIIKDVRMDNVHAEIFNSLGQLVYSSLINRGRNEIQIETSGLHIVRVKVDNNVFSSKVIVK